MNPRRVLTAAILVLASGTPVSFGVSYYFECDVPATLRGVDFKSDQIVRSDSGSYSLALPAAEVLALHRRPDGIWLIVPESPANLGGTFFEPRDVVAFDPVAATFRMVLQGSAAGIPGYARIDALFLDAIGSLVLSFDVPVNLGGVEYGRSDLVRFGGGAFSLYWNAATAGVPAASNVVGADLGGAGRLVVSFDVPTNIGGTEFLPGQLVGWTGAGFGSYFVDPSWPPYAQLRSFAFVPAAGAVPDGNGATTPLAVTRTQNAALTLSWGTSCAATDTDYEIYEGTLGLPFAYNHTEKLCTTGGASTVTFAPPSGSAYYLVVPKDAVSEGSYGRASSGAEIPQGLTACLQQQIATTCP